MFNEAHTATAMQSRPAWRWALGIGLPLLGALSWVIWGFAVAAWGPLVGVIPALTCLVAAWLLRSWTGLLVASVVYIGAGAVMWILAVSGSLNIEYVWAIALPGVVLAALGAAISLYHAR